jgi:hypothetical protein
MDGKSSADERVQSKKVSAVVPYVARRKREAAQLRETNISCVFDGIRDGTVNPLSLSKAERNKVIVYAVTMRVKHVEVAKLLRINPKTVARVCQQHVCDHSITIDARFPIKILKETFLDAQELKRDLKKDMRSGVNNLKAAAGIWQIDKDLFTMMESLGFIENINIYDLTDEAVDEYEGNYDDSVIRDFFLLPEEVQKKIVQNIQNALINPHKSLRYELYSKDMLEKVQNMGRLTIDKIEHIGGMLPPTYEIRYPQDKDKLKELYQYLIDRQYIDQDGLVKNRMRAEIPLGQIDLPMGLRGQKDIEQELIYIMQKVLKYA